VAAATDAAAHGSARLIRRARTFATAFIDRSSSTPRARATLAGILVRRLTVTGIAVAALALAGCGSVTDVDDLPPAAGPAHSPPLTQRPAGRVVNEDAAPETGGRPDRAVVDGGRVIAVLSPRERVLEVRDARTRRRIARVPAGVGPTHVVAGPGRLIYVLDTTGDGLLVYELRPTLHLTRRLPILGAPYGIAADPVNHRVWVTTTRTNRLVELADGALPHRIAGFPAVRQPDAVAVDPRRGRVYVTGRADGVVQIVDARDTARRSPRTARR
jgi:DNA-binding beta-propeller fold protein YncE